MPSIRSEYREWIKANQRERDMTAETLERLYSVMLEMEGIIEDPNISSVPVEMVEKWFNFLQFSLIKELTGRNQTMITEGEIKDAVEKRLLTESYQREHQD